MCIGDKSVYFITSTMHARKDTYILVYTSSYAGFYMFIEANGRMKGQRAWLYSQYFPPTQAACLSFWYHMYGAGMLCVVVIVTRVYCVLSKVTYDSFVVVAKNCLNNFFVSFYFS